MKQLKGIMPPITTPFINGELAIEKLEFNINKWNKTELTGYIVMGSNGESVFLTRDEKVKLVEMTKRFAAPDKIIIAGTGSDSIKETISLSNECADNGADFALVLTPSFYKSEMKHAAFIKYFTPVADAIKIPLIIYNVPKYTGVDIEADTVAKLSEHPNIVGIKNSSENVRQNNEYVSQSDKDFALLVGTASMLYSGFTAGAVGGILALANIAPEECIGIQKLIEKGELKKALDLQNRVIPVNKAVTAKYGVPGLKYAMDLLGYFGGEPRAPLSVISDNEKSQLKEILKKAELITE